MQKNLAMTSSPHLRDHSSTRQIMQEVCLALAPAGLAAILHYGSSAAMLIYLCVVTCVAAEYLWQKINKQPVTIGDWSAVVTGLLLAYNLPASAPWWIAVIGSLLAIILVKQLFGGIGSNFMNPALTARAILFVSWGSIMLNYPVSKFVTDATSSATPLATLNEGTVGNLKLMDLLLGNHGGVLGETCAFAIIIGGVFLLVRKIADWRIPVFFIGTVFVCYLAKETIGLACGENAVALTTALKDGAEIALFHILSGGLLLGAFFMATDYATSPVTSKGRIIMGIGCGLFLFLIRAYASLPEGCSFAILFMNVCTPIIDRFTMPRPFGEVKKHG